MEAKVNTSNRTRTFVQITCPTLFQLGCSYRALGYLSGMLFRVKRKLHNRKYALFTGGTIMV
jgi:hypothetical protein